MAKSGDKRNWETIVYPESAPYDWQDILEDMGIAYAISPLHDSDVVTRQDIKDSDYWTEEDLGKLKSPHYHVYQFYEQAQSFDVAKSNFLKIGGVNCKWFSERRSKVRYLAHMDSKNKYHYDPYKIIGGNGFADKVFEYIQSNYDDESMIDCLFELIEQEDIKYYCDFIQLVNRDYPDWKRVSRGNTIMFKGYITERRYKYKDMRGIK